MRLPSKVAGIALPSLTVLAFSLLTGCVTPGATTPTNHASLSGELTTRSPLNLGNGTRYQQFNLSLQEGEAVRFALADNFEGSLLLIDAQQQVVAGPHDNSLSLVIPSTGNYKLAVSGAKPNSYGPFQVTTEYLEAKNSGNIAINEEVLGLRSNNATNSYTLNITEEGLYKISLDSDDFDALVKLTGNGVDVSDDDGGDQYNALLSQYLKPGQYTITSTSYDTSSSGAYTLKVVAEQLPAGVTLRNSGALPLNGELMGITADTPRRYTLNVPSRSLVTLTMTSESIDSQLELQGRGIQLSDDDGAGGLNAQILAVLEAGTYSVRAKSHNGAAGLFTLTSSARELSANSSGNVVTPGGTIAKRLNRNGNNNISLRIARAGEYRVSLYSSDFDAVLELSGNGYNLSDDDSAGGTNARIDSYLEAGTYQLTPKSYQDEKTGNYVLIVEEI